MRWEVGQWSSTWFWTLSIARYNCDGPPKLSGFKIRYRGGRPWWSRAQQRQADLHPQALALTCWPCWPRIARSGLLSTVWESHHPKKCNFPRANPLKVVQFSAFEEEINKSLILAIFCWSAHYWVQNSLPVPSLQWPGKKIMSSCGKGQLSTETDRGFFFFFLKKIARM